jgi:2,5-dioxopentanoate dehydrogenase
MTTRTFHAVDPRTAQPLPSEFRVASHDEVEEVCALASEAFDVYARTPPQTRAALLRDIALRLENAADEIVARAHAETALPPPRLVSELGRTCRQLRLFAEVVEDGSWVDARIDSADSQRQPPVPDVRSMRRPIGPIAVFGASNFPLAFSTAGGDTASALAAGNPVIVKAHPAHPGTSAIVGRLIAGAVEAAGLPRGTFALLFDDGVTVGQTLAAHRAIRAVGFTGSRKGGEALMRIAASRPDPVPVYAEMGSVNPIVIFPGALRERGSAIAEGLHASFTQGVGQFCTNPGVVLVPTGAEGDAFVEELANRTRATAAGAMLTPSISSAYRSGLEALQELGAQRIASGAEGTFSACGEAALWQVSAARALEEPRLLSEVFGPSTLILRYDGVEDLASLARDLEGQLTATLHALPHELREHDAIVQHLARKAGRLVFNQFPTGVEVNHAMVHGGPFPATSDGQSTSVGTRAIERFTRLVAFQNWPEEMLPEELRDGNPRGIWRLVNGKRTRDALRAV